MSTPTLSSPVTAYNDGLFTLKQIACRGHVSVKTVRRLIARGELKTHRIGAQIRVSETDWQAYLASAMQT